MRRSRRSGGAIHYAPHGKPICGVKSSVYAMTYGYFLKCLGYCRRCERIHEAPKFKRIKL